MSIDQKRNREIIDYMKRLAATCGNAAADQAADAQGDDEECNSSIKGLAKGWEMAIDLAESLVGQLYECRFFVGLQAINQQK